MLRSFAISTAVIGGGMVFVVQKKEDIGHAWLKYHLNKMKSFDQIDFDTSRRPFPWHHLEDGVILGQTGKKTIQWIEEWDILSPYDGKLTEYKFYTDKLLANNSNPLGIKQQLYLDDRSVVGISSNYPQQYDTMYTYYNGACMAMCTEFMRDILIHQQFLPNAVNKYKKGYPNHFKELNDSLTGVFMNNLITGKYEVNNNKFIENNYKLKITYYKEFNTHRNPYALIDNIQSLSTGVYYCMNNAITENSHVISLVINQEQSTIALFDPNVGALLFVKEDIEMKLYQALAKLLNLENCAGIVISRVEAL